LDTNLDTPRILKLTSYCFYYAKRQTCQNLNPIENAFAKLKALLRKAAARTLDQLWQAIADIIQTYSPRECRNYFTAAGYDAD